MVLRRAVKAIHRAKEAPDLQFRPSLIVRSW